MEDLLWGFIGILFLAILILSMKLYLLKKSAREIKEAFADRLTTDTNTLIDISSHDQSMCELADSINIQLQKLRSERHRFHQGDVELKEAITNISHDLRTPLTAICGYLDILEQEEKSEEVKRYLEVIQNRTEILKQLTEELFRYSVVTSTLDDISYEEVVLNHVLEESISGYYAVIKEHHIIPVISIPEEKVFRKLNKKALSRIFENVISNAIKYSDGDLDILLSKDGEVIFTNSASKLSKLQVDKMFQRFYTVETGTNSNGLGLSIAKALTEKMNGSITASYIDGKISIQLQFVDSVGEIV